MLRDRNLLNRLHTRFTRWIAGSTAGSTGLTVVASWVGVVAIAWGLGIGYRLAVSPELRWIRSIEQQKHQLVAADTRSPRILIAGGSGTHFGLDTAQIEQQLGIPTYNLGLHAGLGLNGILASLEQQVQPGDIVVLIPEYELLSRETGTGVFSGVWGLASGQLLHMNLSPNVIIQEVMAAGNPGAATLGSSLFGAVRGQSNADYYTQNLDSRGNSTQLKSGQLVPVPFPNLSISATAYQTLQTFQSRLAAQDVDLVFLLPWRLGQITPVSQQQAQEVAQTLSEIAPTYANQTLNLSDRAAWFGDTVYHLSIEGRNVRSQQVARQLSRYLRRR